MVLKATRKDIYFDDLETRPDTARRLFLERKLVQALKHAYKHAPSAREIMDRAHVNPGDIRSIKHLVRLPITRKPDLIELQKSRPPYGGFLAIKPENVERVFISQDSIYEPFHSARIKWFAQSLWAAGFRKGDIVLIPSLIICPLTGILCHEALRHCGATVVPTGDTATEIQLQTMRDLKVNGFVGTPSFLMTLIKKAEETGLNFRDDFTTGTRLVYRRNTPAFR